MKGEDYSLEVQGGRLKFRTTSFRAGMGSVLSPVIYSHELSSMLAASVPAAAAFLLLRGAGPWRYPALVAAYAGGFLFARLLVFKKRFLTLDADKTGDVLLKLPFRAAKRFGASEVEKVEAEHTTIMPENLDGLRQVEKIALHHRTVLPELDKPRDFYTVRLHLKRGPAPVEIYSGRNIRDAAGIVAGIRKFLLPEKGNGNA